MKVIVNDMKELIEVLDHFKIDTQDPLEWLINFPYPLELKTAGGEPLNDDNEYTFLEFNEKYL